MTILNELAEPTEQSPATTTKRRFQ